MINIGLEGMMILGTWGAAWAGYQWGPWAAVIGGLVFGALGGLLHAVATVTFNVNHIVSGVAITCSAWASRKYLSTLLFVPVSRNPRQSPRVRGLRHVLDAAAGRLAGRAGGPAAGAALRRRPASLGGLVSGLTPLVVHRVRARADQLVRAVAHPVRAAAALVRGEPGGRRVARA